MKYRELRKKLKGHGIEEDVKQGKGAHRTFYKGDIVYPIPYQGDNEDIKPGYLKDIERRFGIKL